MVDLPKVNWITRKPALLKKLNLRVKLCAPIEFLRKKLLINCNKIRTSKSVFLIEQIYSVFERTHPKNKVFRVTEDTVLRSSELLSQHQRMPDRDLGTGKQGFGTLPWIASSKKKRKNIKIKAQKTHLQ